MAGFEPVFVMGFADPCLAARLHPQVVEARRAGIEPANASRFEAGCCGVFDFGRHDSLIGKKKIFIVGGFRAARVG
jgi:hypothetical protein